MGAVAAAQCSNEFTSAGVEYDLSPIMNGDSAVFEFTRAPYNYKFSVCTPLPEDCLSTPDTMGGQYANDGQCFKNLGVLSQPHWNLLDSAQPAAGVSLTYGGGTTCYPE